MAVPHLGRIDTPKVLVFREPVAVVRSLLGIRFFETPGPYLDFALRHEPRLAKMSPVNAAWLWWSAWNERALPHVDATFRVDRPAWERVASFTDIPVRDLARAAMTVGDGYNSRVWADLVDVFDGVDTKLIERAGELYLNLRR